MGVVPVIPGPVAAAVGTRDHLDSPMQQSLIINYLCVIITKIIVWNLFISRVYIAVEYAVEVLGRLGLHDDRSEPLECEFLQDE